MIRIEQTLELLWWKNVRKGNNKIVFFIPLHLSFIVGYEERMTQEGSWITFHFFKLLSSYPDHWKTRTHLANLVSPWDFLMFRKLKIQQKHLWEDNYTPISDTVYSVTGILYYRYPVLNTIGRYISYTWIIRYIYTWLYSRLHLI